MEIQKLATIFVANFFDSKLTDLAIDIKNLATKTVAN